MHIPRFSSALTLLASPAAVLLGLAASTAFAPVFAANPAPQKTTGSHIARESQTDTTELERVEVMLGAVRDARSAAREARDEASDAPNLPLLDANAFLDDTAMQPR